MRALAVDPDVIVVVSAIWQTTCTAVRASDEGFVIDSPVLPDELDALPSLMEQAGFPVSGLLATHGDWDHLLGRLAFPERRSAPASRPPQRLAAEPGAAQRALREFDEEHYVEGRRPLGLAGIQALPVPGSCRSAMTAPSSNCIQPTGTPRTGRSSGFRGWRCSSAAITCRRSRSRWSVSEARRAPTSKH